MEKWKEARISYIDFIKDNCIFESKLINFMYPLNFENAYKKHLNSRCIKYINGINTNIEDLLLIYYKINTFYKNLKDNNIAEYKYVLKTEIEHFIMRYRIVSSKILELRKELKNKNIAWSTIKYFTDSEEYKQLISIRNDIAHESIRSHVFYGKDVKREAVQFYTNRSLDNNIYLDKVFLSPEGAEIYDLNRLLTWLIVILLNLGYDTFTDIILDIEKLNLVDKKERSYIDNYDEQIGKKYSLLTKRRVETDILIYNLSSLLAYIRDFNPNDISCYWRD
ncbi:hypothetical protein Amet_3987 [Alkaliphilus metalliredigens QYMF]|uniref:Uncharacterized protein n=1 Tax=Alkaliphilus metalliredigens (strain QYMF) TaxID=293826 RepID=A6TV52_ALKMQ|nr:hypothetical protein [Alkaliphilus metalliredigens]ABR50070.1 hypothetical protein Amet_3987 [Alkaliphilus metalliredigens QYMF]